MLKDWNGSDGGFRNGHDWLPRGAPAPGDTLTIASGMPELRRGSFGTDGTATTIHLTGDAGQPAGLLLANTTLTDVRIDEATGVQGDYAARTGTLVMEGTVVNDGGDLSAAGNVPVAHTLDIEMQPHALLVNRGSIGANPNAKLNIDGANTRVENDGSIGTSGGTATIAADISGTGDLVAQQGMIIGGRLELEGAVGAGQTVHLGGGAVQIDKPLSFLGSVDMPPDFGVVNLDGLSAASWATNGSLLELFDASGALADTVRFTPQTTPFVFTVASISDPTYGQGVSIRSVPVGASTNVTGALPQHDFVAVA